MCAASQRETCAGDGNVHLIMVTNVDSRLHGSMIRLATCCMNTVCDDLHREVARHQGNHLLQTQQWDPVGRLLNATSRLGVETFAFYPASNLLDEKNQQVQRPLDHDPKRNTLMDNLLREYAGSQSSQTLPGSARSN